MMPILRKYVHASRLFCLLYSSKATVKLDDAWIRPYPGRVDVAHDGQALQRAYSRERYIRLPVLERSR